jgi:hypothetical protein
METFYRERAYLTRQNQADTLPPANFLALSGGGDNGAFGAGLLCGWTAGGTRPIFKGVTGISTGALIAPFAFLGPKYDSALREVYAQSAPKGILEARYFLAAIFEDALAILSGCASSDVTTRQPYTGERVARPDRIIVHDFAATSADVPAGSALAGRSAEHPTPQTAEQIETGRQLGAHVAKELVAEIRDMGLPAVRAAGQPPPRVGDLVIRAYSVSIDPGSAGERVLVGFGSGAAELRTVVEGYLMTRQGLRRLGSGQLESGGSKTPGMLVGVATLAATGNPISLIVGGASKLRGEEKGLETIEGAAQRTAQEIAEKLRVKFQEQGWI